MANEPIYNVASLDFKNKLCSSQTAVETRILPLGVSISKILTYSANVSVEATDVFTGEARISGKVYFKVLYLDSESNLKSSETITEFNDKIADDSILNVKPLLISRVLDIDITSLSADEIKLAAIVEMDLYDNISSRIKYLQVCPEGIYALDSKAEYSKLSAKAIDSVSLFNEISVIADKILMIDNKIVVLQQNAGMDNVLVEGQIISNILTEKEGNLYSYRLVTPFSNECEAMGAKSGCFVDSNARICDYKASLQIDEEQCAVSIDFEIELTSFIYTDELITPLKDAFSISNELSLTNQEYKINKNRDSKTVLERIEGNVTLDSDMPMADKILAVVSDKLNLANTYVLDDKLILEGTVTASVIYFSEETKTKNSLEIELPFSITTNEYIKGEIISGYGIVKDISTKIRRGNEIDIKAEIYVTVSTLISENISVIADLSVGESVSIPMSAISLHITKEQETLWDVAKSLKTTPEQILLQNPQLSLPLSAGERIIIYRHIKKN